MAEHRKLDRRRDDLCGAGLRKRVQDSSMSSENEKAHALQ